MGVESIKDIYQYPTVRTWRRHSRTPCSMLTRGDLAKRADVVDVESGELPAPECSWMMALRLRARPWTHTDYAAQGVLDMVRP